MNSGIFDTIYSTCYTGDSVKYFRKLDDFILKLLEAYKTEEVIISSYLDKEILEKLNYFTDFPNYLCEFKGYIGDQGERYLTPSACLQIYPLYKLYFEPVSPEIVTSLVRVFRSEMEYDYFRKNEFLIREIVFFGSQETVERNIENVWRDIFELARNELDCKIYLQNSSDNFYPSAVTQLKKRMQIANDAKQELLAVINGKKVTLGSKNYHSRHFSKTFNFNDSKIVTGCIGIALDKWVKIHLS